MVIFMKNRKLRKYRILEALKYISSTIIGAGTSLLCTTKMYCIDWFKKSIEIYDDGADPVETAGEMTSFAADVVRILGVFILIGCFLKYQKGLASDSPNSFSEAAVGVGVGMTFLLMPSILPTLF